MITRRRSSRVDPQSGECDWILELSRPSVEPAGPGVSVQPRSAGGLCHFAEALDLAGHSGKQIAVVRNIFDPSIGIKLKLFQHRAQTI